MNKFPKPPAVEGSEVTLIELNPGDCFTCKVGVGVVIGLFAGGDVLVELIGSGGRQTKMMGLDTVKVISQKVFNREEAIYAKSIRTTANRLVGNYSHLAKTHRQS